MRDDRGATPRTQDEADPVTVPMYYSPLRPEPTQEHDVSILPATVAAELLLELQNTRKRCAELRAELQSIRAYDHIFVPGRI